MSLVHDSGSRRGWFRAGWVAGAAVVVAAILLVAAVAVGARERACDRWTGATSRRWNVSSNWSAGVPTSSTAVCISASAPRPSVILDGMGAAATVSVGRSSELSIETGGMLRAVRCVNVVGTLAFASSTAALRTPLVDVIHGGVMTGVGEVHGNVANAGALAPADGGTVPLRISGNYAQGSSGVLLSQQQGGFVRVDAGSASLGGRLDLLIEDALVPGTKLVVLSAAKLTGSFAYVTPGYVVHYGRRAVRMVVTPEIRLGRSRVKQGSAVAVFGASFGYGGTVRFRLDKGTGRVLGSANVNSVGGFEGFAHVPATTGVGPHTLVATNTSLGYTAKTELTVTASDTA